MRAMSSLRSEVVVPRSTTIGVMPSSRRRSAAKRPAGPEPTTMTRRAGSACFHAGVKAPGVEPSASAGGCSPTQTEYRRCILTLPRRASIDFFLKMQLLREFSADEFLVVFLAGKNGNGNFFVHAVKYTLFYRSV